jgi:hypothetical protein
MLPVCGAVAHAFLPGQACALLARAIVLPHGGCERVLLSVCTSAHVHRPSKALALQDLVAVQPRLYMSALCARAAQAILPVPYFASERSFAQFRLPEETRRCPLALAFPSNSLHEIKGMMRASHCSEL